jgi:DNA invertase Pin-like site-specific DNA recombinase
MRRAALYVRVSTERQQVQNHVAVVRQLAAARGLEPVIYEEVDSAASRYCLARAATTASGRMWA